MAKSKSVLKEFFKSGKIPIESNFADLIDKIPVGGGVGIDNTLSTVNTDNPYITGYRFVALDDNYCYIIFGLYDASNGYIIPYIVFECRDSRPLEETSLISVKYAICNSTQMNEWFSAMGNVDMHRVDDTTLINAMPSDISWRDIGISYGKRYSAAHVLLEATDVYEKHWYNVGSPHGAVVEMAKTDEGGRWIIYYVTQISATNNIASIKEYIPNGTATLDRTYDNYVNSFRNNPNKPSDLTTFIGKYLKSK